MSFLFMVKRTMRYIHTLSLTHTHTLTHAAQMGLDESVNGCHREACVDERVCVCVAWQLHISTGLGALQSQSVQMVE